MNYGKLIVIKFKMYGRNTKLEKKLRKWKKLYSIKVNLPFEDDDDKDFECICWSLEAAAQLEEWMCQHGVEVNYK